MKDEKRYMVELDDIQAALLHEIVEGYEAGGESLDCLVSFIFFYFTSPGKTIVDVYRLTLETLESLEKKGIIRFVRQTYRQIDEKTFEVDSEEEVSTDVAVEIRRNPRVWSSGVSYTNETYLYVPTMLGLELINPSLIA